MSAVESFVLGFAVTVAIDMVIEVLSGHGDEPMPLRWLLQPLACLAVVTLVSQWPIK